MNSLLLKLIKGEPVTDEEMNVIYPTDEELKRIEEWDIKDMVGLADYVCELWSDCGSVNLHNNKRDLTLATGGWSGNEEIIEALAKTVFWSLFWDSSHRGGKYIFRGIKELK